MNIDRSQHYQLLLDNFSVQFKNEEFADCILIAERRSVKVHKAILCSNSSFLQEILSDHKDLDVTFIMDGIRFDDLYIFVQFLYRGHIAISSDQVASFLLVAEQLGMKWIGDVSLLPYQDTIELNSSKTDKSTLSEFSSKLLLPLKNITNTLSTQVRKRRKSERTRNGFRKPKIGKKRSDESNFTRAVRCEELPRSKNRLETDLADMDENTFCTALGLKKNVQVRHLLNAENCEGVPPFSKFLSNVKSKFSEDIEVFESANLCESSAVYVEAKNLSYLNIDTNELYIRENNIEIECDVLDITSQDFVFDKGCNATESIQRTSKGKLMIDNSLLRCLFSGRSKVMCINGSACANDSNIETYNLGTYSFFMNVMYDDAARINFYEVRVQIYEEKKINKF